MAMMVKLYDKMDDEKNQESPKKQKIFKEIHQVDILSRQNIHKRLFLK